MARSEARTIVTCSLRRHLGSDPSARLCRPAPCLHGGALSLSEKMMRAAASSFVPLALHGTSGG